MEIEAKIINIMEISPGVSDFINEGGYLHPIDGTTGRGLTDVLIDCMKIIFDELQLMGITSYQEELLLLDSYRNEAAIHLRKLFDEDALRLFIGNLSDDEKEVFLSILDENDPDAEIALTSIMDFMGGSGISNKPIEKIKEYYDDYQLDQLFYKRLKELIRTSVTKQIDTQEAQALIIKFLTHEHEHLRKVKQAANFLMNVVPLEKAESLDLRTRLSIHDGDLIYGSSLSEAANMWNIKEQEKPEPTMLKMALDFKLNHYKRNRHHMSYFEGKEETITDVDLIEIVADRYDEQKTKDEYIKDVEEVFTKVNLSSETKQRIIEVANKLNIW